jgi:hypothetical protein
MACGNDVCVELESFCNAWRLVFRYGLESALPSGYVDGH